MANITNLVNISVYDLSTWLASGYSTIAIFRTGSAGGTYTEITTSGTTRLSLISGTEYYTYVDTSASSTIIDANYKFKYVLSSASSMTDFITDGFYGNSSDLTQELRYLIEDITTPYRYTIKELRRFIKMALWNLQTTNYRKKFYSDSDGIIFPRNDNKDRGVILLQALITATKSQLTRAADTNISYSDGRGRMNLKTHPALIDNMKMFKGELQMAIESTNRNYISPLLVDMYSNFIINDEGWITSCG